MSRSRCKLPTFSSGRRLRSRLQFSAKEAVDIALRCTASRYKERIRAEMRAAGQEEEEPIIELCKPTSASDLITNLLRHRCGARLPVLERQKIMKNNDFS